MGQIHTVMDEFTCWTCRKADGQVASFDYFTTKVAAKCENPNGCRCVFFALRPDVPPEAGLARRAAIRAGRLGRRYWRSVTRAVVLSNVAFVGAAIGDPNTNGKCVEMIVACIVAASILDWIYERKL